MSMVTDYIDMDTQEKIRCYSESSNASTSGYSTMSPGSVLMGGGNISPSSSVYSMPSPGQVPSPASALQTEFSNLNLPSSSPQQQRHYAPLSSAPTAMVSINSNYMNFPVNSHQIVGLSTKMISAANRNAIGRPMRTEFPAELRILEQPVEKFRFRYKSEMHGTHGSLNGANSKRTPKTFPEVELVNFNGRAVIRCSLFQTNLESPHSHQLVVRKDECDICDPHDLEVSPDRGYVAQFQNMGIIHTAKKFIFEELLKKKRNRLEFERGTDELSTKQIQELHRQTEKEAKDMNLNQVRLCFEAFKVDSNNCWTRIAAPVFTNSINNRKSAQTGELRICRLSIATGSVAGGDDLILLVEKVSKKNIKVRFYETNEDDEIVWEAFGKFRESDVHHQYAIVCQTPAYKDKDIDKPVEVCVELIRPSDDERSFPPVTFRYKPRDTLASRKRRRTGSTTTSSSSSASSFSSVELPKTVLEQTANMGVGMLTNNFSKQQVSAQHALTISEEFGDFKEQELQKLTGDPLFRDLISRSSEELLKIVPMNFSTELNFDTFFPSDAGQQQGHLEQDGATSQSLSVTHGSINVDKKHILKKTLLTAIDSNNLQLQKIFRVFDHATKNATPNKLHLAAKEVSDLFLDHADKNEMGDSLLHEIITNDNPKLAIKTCHILNTLKLNDLLNRVVNSHGESGLHCACIHDRPHYIRPLLGLGCDPNIQDRRGNTALHVAVKEKRQKCIESFLNMDNIHIDLTMRNDEGLSPLHLAIRLNSNEAAKLLLKYDKSSALVRNTKEGNNALHMAVQQQNLELVKYIVEIHDKHIILGTTNAAGVTSLEISKSLGSKVDQPLLAYLTEQYKGVDIKFTVKDEEISSSSTDDDDSLQMLPMAVVDVKEENPDDDMASGQDERRILVALNNTEKFDKLATLLDKADKWKLVAKKSNLQRYACLWTNANAMLNYIKSDSSAVDCDAFAKVLAEVDKEAFKTLQT